MAERQSIKQPDNKYFHIMLNMADDDLDVYEYRLLGHYIRVGETFEGTRTTAKKTKMSLGKVVSTRNALETKGYIRMEKPETQAETVKIFIIDRMAENVARFSKECSPDEHPVQDMNTRRSPGERKKNTDKKNHKEEKDSAVVPIVDELVKVKERDRLFDGVSMLCFGINAEDESQAAALDANASRIGKIVSFLKKVNSTPEKLWAFKKWYNKKLVDASMPNDLAKFSKHYNDFEIAMAQPESAPETPILKASIKLSPEDEQIRRQNEIALEKKRAEYATFKALIAAEQAEREG